MAVGHLTYAEVHLYYTLPPILLLFLVARPFVSATEFWKVALLSTIAVVYTTPWDNYIIYKGAWTYPKDRVMAVLGVVPVEEYAFFIIQTVFTSLFTLLMQRWELPLPHLRKVNSLFRWGVLLLFAAQFGLGCAMLFTEWFLPTFGRTKDDCFYMGILLAWTAPVLALQWTVAGTYLCNRFASTSISIILPTFYLAWVDHQCLKQQVWQISDDRTLGVMVTNHLPLEEATFFFLVNCMIVFGLMAIDQTLAIIRLGEANRHRVSTISQDWTQRQDSPSIIFWAVWTFGKVDQVQVQNAIDAAAVLRQGSGTFHMASKLLPAPVGEVVEAFYTFCRLGDDLIDQAQDDGHSAASPNQALGVLHTFLDQVYAEKPGTAPPESLETIIETVAEMWSRTTHPTHSISTSPRNASQAVGALRHFADRVPQRVPKRVVAELLEAFALDAKQASPSNATGTVWFDHEDELVDYCQKVAGSVGEACLHIFAGWRGWAISTDIEEQAKLGASTKLDAARQDSSVLAKKPKPLTTDSDTNSHPWQAIVDASRSMGVALQLVNIARDIGTDAELLSRLYIPASWLTDPAETCTPTVPVSAAALLSDPWAHRPFLAALASRALSLADVYAAPALSPFGVPVLAPSLRVPVRLALMLYMEIGNAVRVAGVKYPRRATVGSARKLQIALRCMLGLY
ncbi:hypothetical protein HDU96_009056 [Phlyctochytrium bullatum]|nr:hypothetical protein HDU96_009056 [Phlyctochytrium bullatum]